jgi:D-alanine-D-alanine ligase
MSHPEPPISVAVLYNYTENLVKGEAQDLIADQAVIACAHAVANALVEKGYRAVEVPFHADVESALAPYPPEEWVIFNLAEGIEARLFEASRIILAMEAMGYRFTGCGSMATINTTNKAWGRAMLSAAGVLVPPGRTFTTPAEVTPEATAGLPFPLIVKAVAEDASVGICSDAVVKDAAALMERVAFIKREYRQVALAEQFIQGREIAAAMWGDPVQVLPLTEQDFSAFKRPEEKLVSFASKWLPDSYECLNLPAICPAVVTPELYERIKETAIRTYHALKLDGYARVDMRISEQDVPYVIDVNSYPDLSDDAGFYRSAKAAGYDYATMVETILKAALGRSEPPVVIEAAEADGAEVLRIAAAVRVFTPTEIATVDELWQDYISKGEASPYRFLVCRKGGGTLGFACYGLRSLATGVYDLYWIAVPPEAQQLGAARALIQEVERQATAGGGRLLFVETSGSPEYLSARRFYDACGYQYEATVRDLYKVGDDLVVFVKRLK